MKRVPFITLLICIIILSSALVGCTPPDYTKEQYNAEMNAGAEIITDYLGQHYQIKPSKKFSVIEARPTTDSELHTNMARYLSHVVKGSFILEGNEYVIYADTQTGDIYTDCKHLEIEETLSEILEEEFAEAGVACSFLTYLSDPVIKVTCTNVPTKENGDITTLAEIRTAYPATIDKTNAEDFLLDILKDSSRSISITACTAADGRAITEEIWEHVKSDYPGISNFYIYTLPQNVFESYLAANPAVPGMDFGIHVKEDYHLFSGYTYDKRTTYTQEDIHINYVSSSYNYNYETQIVDEKTHSLQNSAENDKLIFTTDTFKPCYIYFDGQPKNKHAKAKLSYKFSDKPLKMKYKIISSDYYTIDSQYDPGVFDFIEYIGLER